MLKQTMEQSFGQMALISRALDRHYIRAVEGADDVLTTAMEPISE
jgi:hypothetical protein